MEEGGGAGEVVKSGGDSGEFVLEIGRGVEGRWKRIQGGGGVEGCGRRAVVKSYFHHFGLRFSQTSPQPPPSPHHHHYQSTAS